jgi:hypothetical protein
VRENDIAWLAGYLEGEGYFVQQPRGAKGISVSATDPDVLCRVADIAGRGEVRELKRSTDKQVYRWYVFGAPARNLMASIAPLMGNRRRARINEILGTNFGADFFDFQAGALCGSSLSWLCGLWEGEGTYGLYSYYYPRVDKTYWKPRCQITMTDLDALERVAAIVGVGKARIVKRRKSEGKPAYVWATNAQDTCVNLMTAMLPHMGLRRRAKIHEIMEGLSVCAQ